MESSIEYEYFPLQDIDIIGHLGFVKLGNRWPSDKVITVLKKNNNTFLPGYMLDEDFIQFPISIFNVRLNSVENIRNDRIIANINIYSESQSKHGYKCRELNLNMPYYLNDRYSGWHGLGLIAKVINCLNIYIKEEKDIDLLNLELFESWRLIEPIDLIKLINNLSFKFESYENCRVGRDNSAWNEVTIDDSYKSKYISGLMVDILDKNLSGVKLDNDKIIIRYDEQSGYCSFGGDREFYDEGMANNIKDLLKFHIKEYFDIDKEIIERMLNYSPVNEE